MYKHVGLNVQKENDRGGGEWVAYQSRQIYSISIS